MDERDADESEEPEDEGWIYLPPEEVQRLQWLKTEWMIALLDRLSDNESSVQVGPK